MIRGTRRWKGGKNMDEVEKQKIENAKLKEEINTLKGVLKATQDHLVEIAGELALEKLKNQMSK